MTAASPSAVAVHHRADGPAGAPPVVLSNSLGSTLGVWDRVAPALAESFRVIRYDLRGHGQSPVPPGPYAMADLGADIVALLDRLQIERAHLVGLSLGGMASLWVAAHHPDRVDRLVVCCSSARLPPEGWAARAATVDAQGTGAVADAVVDRWLTPAFARQHPAVRDQLRAMIAGTPAAGYAACCRAIETMDLRPDLGRIRAPTLAIAAADDPAIPPPHQQLIAASVQNGRAVVVGEAAHLITIEQPAQIADLVTAHLGAAPQSPTPPRQGTSR